MAVMTYYQVKQAQSFSFWTRMLGLSILVHVLGISYWINTGSHYSIPLEMVSQFNVVLETQQKSKPMVATKEIKTEATSVNKQIKKIVKQRAISVKHNSKLKSTTLVRKPRALKKSFDINKVENEKVIREEQVAFVSPSISTDINNRKPYYPLVARRRGMQGNVLLQVSVGIHGEVLDVVIKQSSGYLLLDEAAKETIKEWQFQPAQRDGKFEIGRIEIPIRFNLQNS